MAAIDVARSLPCWRGKVEPKPIKGGITNANFLVEDAGQRYFVRVGEDIPIHGVMRFNERAAGRAAAACGCRRTCCTRRPAPSSSALSKPRP